MRCKRGLVAVWAPWAATATFAAEDLPSTKPSQTVVAKLWVSLPDTLIVGYLIWNPVDRSAQTIMMVERHS
jgi:hypothetical protein